MPVPLHNSVLSSRYAIKLPTGEWISGGHTMHVAHERATELGGTVMEFGTMFWREVVDKRQNKNRSAKAASA